MKYAIFTFFALVTLAVTVSAFAANQVRTTETLVLSDFNTVGAATSTSFSLYIGDNLSGVSTPIKSAQVAVSGVYTTSGGGPYTVAVQVDSGTTKTFTMANVSTTPTPFEILYDASGTVAPTSAGTYTYTLTVTPTNVTVYGISAKLSETHEWVPASCADGQPANEKIKTTETFILSDFNSVSSATSSSFSLYIGDNLSGVTTPVKSAHIAISGVYTGNGTLQAQLDSDAATSQTFTLPNVSSTPTPFEVLYKDPSGKINPASAGTYTYTLGLTPSGITMYELAAKLEVTHRYKPPTCGGFAATGYIESSTFDTGISGGAAYNSILWNGALGTGNVGRVKLQIATSNSAGGPWNYAGPGAACDSTTFYEPAAGTPVAIDLACSAIQNKRYFRYKVTICSANNCSDAGSTTPTVNDVIINWSP